jgi:hypothetical protein
MTTKIGDLTQIGVNGPQDDDIFVLNDFSEGETKRVTFNQIKDNIIDPQTFTDNDDITKAIIDAINGYSGEGINATKLNNQLPSFYLDYAELGETRLGYVDGTEENDLIPNDDITKLKLSTLFNDSGFVQYDTAFTPPRLVYKASPTTLVPNPATISISTKNVIENPDGDSGLYYTNQRVIDLLAGTGDGSFANFYTQFTATFDETNIKDALFEVEGTFVDIGVSGNAEEQSNRIQVTDQTPSIRENFAEGQTIRVYGGVSLKPAQNVTLIAEFDAEKIGFTGTTGAQVIDYKIAEFEYSTGEISPTSVLNTSTHRVTINIPEEQEGVVSSALDAFNTSNFVKINLDSDTTSKDSRGVLVYRKIAGVDSDFILIAVLGQKEVSANVYNDYFTFDYVSWSGKNENNNSFYFGDGRFEMVHFPVIAHGTTASAARRGWQDVAISSVGESNGDGTFDIILESTLYVNADGACNIAHNDTTTIQNAINSNEQLGRKTITLNAKNYIAESVALPDEFGINGTPYITKLTKLPWSGLTANNNNLIKHKTKTADIAQVSLIGFDIDGASKYQVQFIGGNTSTANYLVNYGIQPRQPFIDRVRILSTSGGGVFAQSAIDLRIVNSEIRNSGVSDAAAYAYHPLFATGSRNVTVTSNTFENFGENIDLSVTNKGVCNGNIITNCGSGLSIYGSTFFISNPNVLTGPAGEFIPTPDRLNSVYDSINIDVTDDYLAGNDYISPAAYKYQENGQDYDLTATDGVGSAQRVYSVHYLQRSSNGVEEFWTPTTNGGYTAVPIVISGASSFEDPTTQGPQFGDFYFSIPWSSLETIKLAGEANSYSALVEQNPLHVGLVYTVHNERENTISGTIQSVKNESNGEVYTTQTQLDNAGNPDFVTTDYTIRVPNLQVYGTVGSRVRLLNHDGFSVNGAGDEGIIVGVNENAGVSDVTIRYSGATSITPGDPTTGVINIINKFLLAQGRIF